METIGKTIRDARIKKGMTQKDLASVLNVSRSSVAHWESGAHLPDAEMLLTLSKTLDCSFLEAEADSEWGETPPAAPDLIPQPAEERQELPETPEKPVRKAKQSRLMAAAAAAVLIAAVLLAVFLPRGGRNGDYRVEDSDTRYRLEDFQAVTPRAEDLPYLNLSVKEEVQKGDSASFWMYEITLREENGFPFTVDRVENVWFCTGGVAKEFVATAGDLLAMDFDPEIAPYGDRPFTGGFRLPQPKIESVGVRVFGHAADGELLSFAVWFPFTVK